MTEESPFRGPRNLRWLRRWKQDPTARLVEGDRSIEIEVFCNRCEPTVSEIEQNTLPGE